MKQPNKKLSFSNLVIDKKQLKSLIVWAFRNYGIARAANMSDRLKDLGFYYATKAGISLSLEDLKIPPMKKILLQNTIDLIINVDYKYKRGEITAVERFQKVIDIWNNSSETLKEEVVKYFKYTDPLNAIYIMAFSGARGNISQVRQLVGMRGLMSDPQGQIIDLPISSNFREGLTVTDYFISSYGARKGLVDTALRTADSGYLTRRLVDVAQDVIIREIDCKTSKGILLENFFDNKKLLISLKQSLMGRVLAEDLFHPLNNRLIAHANEDVNDFIINSIINANISKVLVRSPITCNSKGSVCRKCYGWNLAHSKLVDLGEAVGIIAAQSIGEPGTQLTMRTFHTGGVFTGELADKVYAPCDGIIKHPDLSFLKLTRTSHGDKAYLIKKDCSIVLYNVNTSQQHIINLTTKSLLLVDDMTRVYYNQVIAEYPLRNRLITEKAKKFIVADIAGKIAFTNLKIEKDHNKQNSIKSAQSGGLIWVLSGQVHNIPDNSHLTVKKGSKIFPGIMLAITEIRSSYSGYIQISSNFSTQEVLVIIVSQTVLNAEIIMERYYDINSHILKTSNQEKFILKVKPKDKIVHQQIIAELLSDVYKTDTGGIIKFLDLPVSQNKDHANDNSYNVLGAGYILWISEETHEINKDVSLLLVKHGDFINAGTELIRNIISKNSGIVEIIEKDNIVKEIIIKPCTIYNVEDEMLLHQYTKRRGFLRPGENIVENIITNKLVYWEYLDIYERKVLLVRPVVVYSIPNKNYNFTYTQDSFRTDAIYLCIKRKIHFKDGARVKSVEGIDLIKTYLTVDILEELSSLTCFIDFIDYGSSLMKLKFIIADSIFIKDDFSLSYGVEVTYRNKLLVSDKMFVNKGDVIAQTELLSNVEGRIIDIQQSQKSSGRFLILTENDKYVCNISQCNNVKVHLYDWVYKNQEVAQNIYTSESGQVIYIDNEKIVLRIGRPYLISNGSIVHIDHNNLVQKGENIATLIFNRVKTGDIVQGLPRIEEILEARKKVDSNFNPHCLLENKFRYYINLGLSVYDATRISVQEIQLLLVKEVQLVYQAQGVDISDKHIEVIVKQMTAKVKIDNGGDTNYLPGEITDLQQIESINQTLFEINKQRALYHPILLGITKASLNTQSFISAASFQETTKVLTEAAISGKLDWLKGLKENVIIGRLIPAGTGFSNYNLNISTSNFNNERLYASDLNEILDSTVNNYLEDIILDDRGVRNATHSKFNNIDLQPSTDII